MRRRCFLGLVALLLPVMGIAADGARRFTELGVGRGLDARVVVTLLVDRNGLLWVGSREGLFRYDGYQASAFLPDPERPGQVSDIDIRALYEAADGGLWIATNTGGLNRRDPKSGTGPVVGRHPAWLEPARSGRPPVRAALPRAR